MERAVSKDGATIAYDQVGQGSPLILVDGAFCGRSFGPMPKLAPLLAQHFTVIYYDRRGRGDSGDTAPYGVEREIEDLEALVDAAGGSAFLYGTSAGAVLARRRAEGPHWMHHTAQVVADSIPNAGRRTLEGQTHDVAAKAIAPVLVGFFAS